mgnify:CR=1 FL=1
MWPWPSFRYFCAGDHVTLTFTHMDIEELNNCGYDYVEVLDGDNAMAPRAGKYCGTRVPPPIVSSGMALFVIFKSDASDERGGFRAVYTKSISCKCYNCISLSPEGTTSQEGSLDTYCHMWLVRRFQVFPIEQWSPLVIEILLVIHHVSFYTLSLCFLLLSNPNNYGSKTNVDGSFAFLLAACGADLTAEHGSFNSPQYPMSYPNSVECVWNIRTSPGNRVHLSFR